MLEKSFIKEWNERAGFVAAIATINPVILTAYVMFYHKGAGALEFWLVGMGLTFIVCLLAGSFMLTVIVSDRRKRERAERKLRMWDEVMPYDASKARSKGESSTEPG